MCGNFEKNPFCTGYLYQLYRPMLRILKYPCIMSLSEMWHNREYIFWQIHLPTSTLKKLFVTIINTRIFIIFSIFTKIGFSTTYITKPIFTEQYVFCHWNVLSDKKKYDSHWYFRPSRYSQSPYFCLNMLPKVRLYLCITLVVSECSI